MLIITQCADITFTANAPKIDSAVCTNTTGITAEYIGAASHHEEEAAASPSPSATGTGTTPSQTPSAAAGGFGGSAVSAVVVGFAAIVMSYLL